MNRSDFLIIGGGIIGISIARELKKRFHGSQVVLIEKENQYGAHASGRNSGVLHAGFYYSSESLKAKFTRIGNQRLTEFCDSRKLKINKCGKLVVAKNRAELKWIDELLDRAKKNGVPLEDISEKEAKSIEPRARTCERALFSPTTSSVDPIQVMQAIADDAIREGVTLRKGVRYLGRQGEAIRTSDGLYETGYLVNAAGLYADEIGRHFEFSQNYRILPFKGLYLYSDEPPGSLRAHIYPVPDLRNPFLGVHFTATVDGKTKIGPTAMPAFWREQYHALENFRVRELLEIIRRQIGLFAFSNFDFKKLAFEEMRKYSRRRLVTLAAELLEGVDLAHYKQWGTAGIRAQLLDIKKMELEMDFVIEGDDKSLHVLNAVSPAFTCAFPFSEYVCDKIQTLMN